MSGGSVTAMDTCAALKVDTEQQAAGKDRWIAAVNAVAKAIIAMAPQKQEDANLAERPGDNDSTANLEGGAPGKGKRGSKRGSKVDVKLGGFWTVSLATPRPRCDVTVHREWNDFVVEDDYSDPISLTDRYTIWSARGGEDESGHDSEGSDQR